MTGTGIVLAEMDRASLDALEKKIDRDMASFISVGRALSEIRDRELYVEYGTFEEYLTKRWDLKKSHGYRLIGAAVTQERLLPIWGQNGPANEAQMRPLLKFKDDPDAQAAVWMMAVDLAGHGRITAGLVEKAVDQLYPRKKKRLSTPAPVKKEDLPQRLIDVENAIGELIRDLRADKFATVSKKQMFSMLESARNFLMDK